MIYIKLINHRLEYEVRELVRLFFFDRESQFVENGEAYLDKELFITSSLEVEEGRLNSTSQVYSKNKLISTYTEKNLQDFNIGEKDIGKKVRLGVKKSIYQALVEISDRKVPWGILTGIRPIKIVHNLLDRGIGEEEVRQILNGQYKISQEKIQLMLDIGKGQRKHLYPLDENRFSLYISIPFCPTRCLYCSFPSVNIKRYLNEVNNYTDKLIYEINNIGKTMAGKSISTVYIGGGTPTAIPPKNLEKIITSVYHNFSRDEIEEFTVEAGRPDTIDYDKLSMLRRNKIDRISINPQTMNDSSLKIIGRQHNSRDIVESYYLAREIGFDSINMDLIIGLPGEGLEEFQKTLASMKDLDPDNLTVHTLSIKRGSRFRETMDEYSLEDQDIIFTMLEKSQEYARKMELYPYYLYRQKQILGNLENIGYAKEGKECIYNIKMMEEKETVIGCGMGAVSKIYFPREDRIERVPNVKSLEEYLARTDEMLDRKIQALDN